MNEKDILDELKDILELANLDADEFSEKHPSSAWFGDRDLARCAQIGSLRAELEMLIARLEGRR